MKTYEQYIKNNKNNSIITDKDIIIGKFVVLDLYTDETIPPILMHFLKTNIGVIADTHRAGGSIIAKYHNVNKVILTLAKQTVNYGITPGSPDDTNLYVKELRVQEIKYVGDSKEELEILIQTNKYNL